MGKQRERTDGGWFLVIITFVVMMFDRGTGGVDRFQPRPGFTRKNN